MIQCEREWLVVIAEPSQLVAQQWVGHLANCQACQDALRLQRLLRSDSRNLGDSATLPSARAMLWRVQIRAGRERRRRIALLFPLAHAMGAGLLAVALLVWFWANSSPSQPPSHTITMPFGGMAIAVAAAMTIVPVVMAVSVIVAARTNHTRRAWLSQSQRVTG